MLLNRENWKLHRVWVIVFSIGLLVSLLAMFDVGNPSHWFSFPGGSSTIGYSLGLVAGAIIVFEVLLWPRKKLMRNWRIGRVRTWMAAHIWLGLLTVPLAIVHAGVPWGGTLATATIVLLLLVVASGIFGFVMQQWIPRKMTREVPGETMFVQIDRVTDQLLAEADALVSLASGQKVGQTDWSKMYPEDKAGSSDVEAYVGASRSIANIFGSAVITELPPNAIANTKMLPVAYETSIRQYLELGDRGSSMLKEPARQLAFFNDLKDKTPAPAHYVVDQLASWCNERRQLDHQQTLHRWLHLWLSIHLPMSLALLVLMIWHAIVASRYSGIF